ncbi:putative tyrosine-protein phosphatase F54C84 isoform X1 [Vespula maculifrons]|uniref:Tyrosine-protein phosphatase F54C84 isoform X1 n=1 Tax=Vespula maculifrons TaxID=7453 RepID=A0ABD2B596_VESMC
MGLKRTTGGTTVDRNKFEEQIRRDVACNMEILWSRLSEYNRMDTFSWAKVGATFAAVVNNLTPEQRFTATILLQAFPRLKCIVDLTNTERYYDKKEFTNVGVKHEKIMIPGKRVPPQNSVMNLNDDGTRDVHMTV